MPFKGLFKPWLNGRFLTFDFVSRFVGKVKYKLNYKKTNGNKCFRLNILLLCHSCPKKNRTKTAEFKQEYNNQEIFQTINSRCLQLQYNREF